MGDAERHIWRRSMDGHGVLKEDWKTVEGGRSQHCRRVRSTGDPAGEHAWWAVTTDEWKLVVKRPVDGDQDLPGELYDRSEDPLDKVDVSAEHPQVVADLTRQLNQWRVAAEQAALASDEELSGTLSEAEAEELRALGYLQ